MSLSQFGIMPTMPEVNLTVDENTIFLLVLESLNMFFEVAKRANRSSPVFREVVTKG